MHGLWKGLAVLPSQARRYLIRAKRTDLTQQEYLFSNKSMAGYQSNSRGDLESALFHEGLGTWEVAAKGDVGGIGFLASTGGIDVFFELCR